MSLRSSQLYVPSNSPNYLLIITIIFLIGVLGLIIYGFFFRGDPCGGYQQVSCPALYSCRPDPKLPYNQGSCVYEPVPHLTFGLIDKLF